MTDNTPLKPQLWTERPPEETIRVYREWAENYDSDLAKRGYYTPLRIADALAPYKDTITGPILDFGCGTGISGVALAAGGFNQIHGTDITEEMLKKAEEKRVYEKLWLSSAGDMPATPGTYQLIVAAGVISLGAAPAETLSQVLDALATGGLLALSFNDPTLKNGRYDKVLDNELNSGRATILFREHGPHLGDLDMGSDVLIISKT